MRTAMNLLLWTGKLEAEHYPIIEKIKGWGADGVELPMFSADASDWKELAGVLDGLGLGRTSVTVMPADGSLVVDDAAERQRGIDHVKSILDACAVVGVETLCGPLHSPVGKLIGRGPTDDEVKRCAESLQAIGEHAESVGVAIAIEPLNRFETYFLNTQAQAATLLAQVSSPAVGVMYDTFHANIEEKDCHAAIRTSQPNLRHVHISACDRGTPGEDHIDYAAQFKTLQAIGYDGWLAIESFSNRLPELAGATCIWRAVSPDQDHVAREGLRFIRETW